jgi:hypothetical protein
MWPFSEDGTTEAPEQHLFRMEPPPTEAALLFCQLLFDIGVHGISKSMPVSSNGIALYQNIFLQQPQAALSGIGGGRSQVLADGSLGEWNAVGVAIAD